MYEEIPDIDIKEEKLKYEFIDSSLVEVTDIEYEPYYYNLGLKYSNNKCFLRKEVYDMLKEARKLLPDGYDFKILDGYRPIELQEELYYYYYNIIVKEFKLDNLSKEEKDKFINQYVALPKKNNIYAPAHTTGGAVDLVLTYKGKTIDFGVKFDEFTDKTKTNYYEINDISDEIKNNRRILYNVMTKVGFTNLPSECWHYDYGNMNWAYLKKEKIKYKGIF